MKPRLSFLARGRNNPRNDERYFYTFQKEICISSFLRIQGNLSPNTSSVEMLTFAPICTELAGLLSVMLVSVTQILESNIDRYS